MIRSMRTVLSLAGALSACLLLAGEAEARTERLRWSHTDVSTVDSFRVHVGTVSGTYTTAQDVGIPPVDAQGAFFHDVTVGDSDTVFVAISAVGSGLVSPLSNEMQRDPSGGGSGANASITGFALWNAASDTVVDSSFVSGEQIQLGFVPCAAIEVLVNPYLQQAGSPGSVLFAVDGATPAACTDLDVTHEDEPPYELGAQLGVSDFECAAELAVAGPHTLAVTPFDGDGCTGVQGSTSVLSFDVLPAPPGTVGVPGRPTLVP